MPIFVAYQKYITQEITRELSLPEDANLQRLGQEIATVDGVTYVSLPDGETLPAGQPTEIAASIVNPATPTAIQLSAIRAASPQCQLIGRTMVDKIRAIYSIDDEMYFARIGVGAATGLYVPSSDEMQEMTVFGAFVESVRQWGREERAKLGL